MASKQRRFQPEQFRPTPEYTARQKAEFCNRLADYVANGFHPGEYSSLLHAMTVKCFFGPAEGKNIAEFYTQWFSTADLQIAFLGRILNVASTGDPAKTLADCEGAIRSWVKAEGVLDRLRAMIAAEKVRGHAVAERVADALLSLEIVSDAFAVDLAVDAVKKASSIDVKADDVLLTLANRPPATQPPDPGRDLLRQTAIAAARCIKQALLSDGWTDRGDSLEPPSQTNSSMHVTAYNVWKDLRGSLGD